METALTNTAVLLDCLPAAYVCGGEGTYRILVIFSRKANRSIRNEGRRFGNIMYSLNQGGRAVAWWLRHYATNRQVTGSIPYGVIGIFQRHNPTGRTMALGSTHPLTEMSTRCISWG